LLKAPELKAGGVSDVLVYAVNDGAVMDGWSKAQGVEGSIMTFMGDPRSELTKALGLVLGHPGPMSVLGNPRCKRFSMLIDDGVIKSINVAASEDDPAGDDDPSVSLVENMLKDL
jgi:2-Cys peroxiredoxin 5